MLSPALLLKLQNITPSLLISKIFTGSKYMNEQNTKVISLTYNTLQSSQISYLRQLFTIQPPRSSRSSSTPTLLRPSVTSSLKFADRSIAMHSSPSLCYKLPPVLCQKYLTNPTNSTKSHLLPSLHSSFPPK